MPLYKYVCYFICLSDKKKVQVLDMSVSTSVDFVLCLSFHQLNVYQSASALSMSFFQCPCKNIKLRLSYFHHLSVILSLIFFVSPLFFVFSVLCSVCFRVTVFPMPPCFSGSVFRVSASLCWVASALRSPVRFEVLRILCPVLSYSLLSSFSFLSA